ncbi:hypothetical protein TSUD_53410 [Trifolium subterraneum]|uniref:Uncharacterized protein n=1 Tax=Trifolium subterraneum TaxID=3900 RepID=A0A2Z6MR14_TRISU|nr:hypothetical protein TSUD_53410 [Trifolium subterraneum]
MWLFWSARNYQFKRWWIVLSIDSGYLPLCCSVLLVCCAGGIAYRCRSHCLDLRVSQKSDPGWLVQQRKKELEIIHGWIAQYYNDLGAH